MLAVVLATSLNAEALMAQVAAHAKALESVQQERQLTYTKELTGDEHKVWRVWWDATGHHEQLVQVGVTAITTSAEESKDLDLATMIETRFHFTGLTELPDGYVAVSFVPKTPKELKADGFGPLDDDEAELIVGHVAGQVIIDPTGLWIVRISGSLVAPFNKNFFARIKSIEATYTQKLFEGIPVLSNSVVEVHYTAFGIGGTSHKQYLYHDYQFPVPTP